MWYWLTHFLTLVAGGTIGAACMAALQINHMERADELYWRGFDDHRNGRPDSRRGRLL
jgi:hypothetical protein